MITLGYEGAGKHYGRADYLSSYLQLASKINNKMIGHIKY